MFRIFIISALLNVIAITGLKAMDLNHEYYSYGLGSAPCSMLFSKKSSDRLAADHWIFGFYTATTILTDGLMDLTDTATSHDPNRDGTFLIGETIRACRQGFSSFRSWQKLSEVANKVYRTRIKEIFKNELQAHN